MRFRVIIITEVEASHPYDAAKLGMVRACANEPGPGMTVSVHKPEGGPVYHIDLAKPKTDTPAQTDWRTA